MICSQYDKIAQEYDSLFLDEESIRENKEVGAMLSPLSGLVYDIGCGTGLLIDIMPSIAPENYIGVDPSMGMLERFKDKHPEYADRLLNIPFEANDDEYKHCDCVVSLFGSISYCSGTAMYRLALNKKCKKFLMFYKPDYYPVTYLKTRVSFDHSHLSLERLKITFFDCKVFEYHNYIIVSNL